MPDPDNSQKSLEFGTRKWCENAAALGVRLVKESDLDLARYNWGFSEEYTYIPERLLAGREKAGYHFMIHNGEVTGGASLPDACLALPGFHVAVPWAMIAHSSYYPFNREGWRERAAAHRKLREDLEAAGIDPEWHELHRLPDERGQPRCPICGSSKHDRPDCPVWPPGIGEVLSANTGKEAKWLRLSPELEGLPETEWGVPIFTQMTDEQKSRFIKLIGK